MKYLLDTCVVSEFIKDKPHESCLSWLSIQNSVNLYISVITIGEIRKGIELARPTKRDKAEKLESWLMSLENNFGEHILSFDRDAAHYWGEIQARVPHCGVEDAQIAAIALSKGMTVVTRNVKDFAPLGVSIVNPFDPP